MAKAQLTKSHIANTFKKLAIKHPVRQIHVREIVEESDINRNTFYYHFSDKRDLIIWIYRTEFAQIMLKEFPDQKLVYDTKIKGEKYANLPFYIDTRSESCNLELGTFWKTLGFYLINQSAYYSHILNSEESDSLSEYLFKIYFVQIQQDIRYAIGNKNFSERGIIFLSAYFTNACIGYIINSTKNMVPYLVEIPISDDISGYLNISHDLIKYLVKKLD